MRYVKLSVIVFLSAALFTGLCYWIGLTGLFLRFSTWFYGLPVLQQMYGAGVIGLVLNSPLIYWLGKIDDLHSYSAHKYGTDSQTGEPIKSLSEIKKEIFTEKAPFCPLCGNPVDPESEERLCDPCITARSQKGG